MVKVPAKVPASVVVPETVKLPDAVAFTKVVVPKKLGEARSALLFTAVRIALNSVSNSEPLTSLLGFPDDKPSLLVKKSDVLL
jgi:hypothetical protein